MNRNWMIRIANSVYVLPLLAGVAVGLFSYTIGPRTVSRGLIALAEIATFFFGFFFGVDRLRNKTLYQLQRWRSEAMNACQARIHHSTFYLHMISVFTYRRCRELFSPLDKCDLRTPGEELAEFSKGIPGAPVINDDPSRSSKRMPS